MVRHSGRVRQLPRRGQGGFTLIELLVVIAILGILAGVVVFATRGVEDRGASAAARTDARTLRTAQEAFCADRGYYASSVDELETAGFLADSDDTPMHDVQPLSDGPCQEDGDPSTPGGFRLICDADEASCGEAEDVVALGGTLVVGESFTRPLTNPASSTSGSVHAYWEIMYNGLLTLDEDGNPSPELATEVPTVANGGITNNGATYTLHLRQDVFWHDSGEVTTANPTGAVQQFTAADVKFTFEKILLQFHGRTRNMAAALGYVGSPTCEAANIVVVDPFTIQFNFLNPYAPFLKQLNVTEAPMNPAHAIATTPACPTQATADSINVGTGPFEFGGLDTPQTGDGRVVKNQDYWREGVPFLDEIIMRPFTNETTRFNNLLSGAVDWIWDVPNSRVAELEANPAFETAWTQSLGGGPNSVDTFIFNLTASGDRNGQIGGPNPAGTPAPHPILGDVRVRRAIFHAINRDEYLNSGRSGIGTVSAAPISSEIFGHATDITLPANDLAAANTLLDQAGWDGPRVTANGTPNTRTALGHPSIADGTPLTIRFLYGSSAFDSRAAILKSNLAAVGIDLQNELDAANASNRVFVQRNFDTHIINYAHGYDPHVGVRRQYHSDQVGTTFATNASGYKNALVDAAFDNAVKTIDPVERAALYHDFQVQVANDLPYVWLIETPNVRGYRATCSGLAAYTGLFAEFASCTNR